MKGAIALSSTPYRKSAFFEVILWKSLLFIYRYPQAECKL